ncbi:hypothetical protein [Pseudaminobacter soli (ex Li et al. 2025)]|uniref:hypothetical protein n=1 Tax=Pseudaminobacter soli (ex Li et al. 2025) TaxID=1295366 RepID=UPI0011B20D22|nr:hypothetical protein [Mesorhizobium soli]
MRLPESRRRESSDRTINVGGVGETMGSRTKDRGNDPASYDDIGLRKEIDRTRMQLRTFSNLNSSLRKRRASRLFNLEKELARRIADDTSTKGE